MRSFISSAAFVGLLTVTLGCVSIDGKLYPASVHSVAKTACVANPSVASSVRVLSFDRSGYVIPGTRVSVTLPSSEPEPYPPHITGPDGVVVVSVAPGTWRVTVSLSGFLPVSTVAVVADGSECTVRVFLEQDPAYVINVT